MRNQARRIADAVISRGLLIASILALFFIGAGAVFAVSMSGSWIPLIIYGIPLCVAGGAIYYWLRHKRIPVDDEVRNELSWRREAINGALILTVAVTAWALHAHANRTRDSKEKPETEQGVADQPATAEEAKAN